MTMSSSKHARRTRGYTAVEVMLAIAILGVGAAGVMSMQKAAIQGNVDARKLDVANAIAREWVERLRRDATTWTLPSESQPTGQNWSTNTVFISQLASSSSISRYVFPTFNANSQWEGYSPAFDVLGRDVAPASGSVKYPGAIFCTQVRLDWMTTDEMLRATVRVYWLSQLYTAPAGDFCNSDGTTQGYPSGDKANAIYHFIYVTTALRKNPAT